MQLHCTVVVHCFRAIWWGIVDMQDPALQQPMYARMLPLLLRHAQYPEDFTTWEECLSVDQEAFESFRCLRTPAAALC